MSRCCRKLKGIEHLEARLTLSAAALADAMPTVPAFPGAEGFGAQTVGGRGGAVLEVTNLQDSGPGSLRAAVEAEGRRLVVFRVAGTIELEDSLKIEHPYLTIAGQTAPGDGITLKGWDLSIRTHDVIVRYLRVRPGPTPKRDSIQLIGAENVIIDHNSLSWSTDEVTSAIDGSANVTFQWNIISEGLNDSTHPEGLHSKGSLLNGSTNLSVHHNLIAHNDKRNPRIGSSDALFGMQTIDVVNNVIYDWGRFATEVKDYVHSNIVANYYKLGPDSTGYTIEGTGEVMVFGEGIDRSIFIEGNIGPTCPQGCDDDWRMVSSTSGAEISRTFQSAERHETAPISTVSAREAYDDVLFGAGAVMPARDAVDRRVIDSVIHGTGGIIDDPSEVGGWPILAPGIAPPDHDHDGMPDAWESEQGFDPDDPADGPLDADGNGYSNVEEYINSLVEPSLPLQVVSMAPTVSGVSFLLSGEIDIDVLNLYDGPDASLDQADVSLVGASAGNVAGSLLWDADMRTLSFVKTGGPLTPDTYSVRLASRLDGIVNLGGNPLDGDANNVAGGDFARSFIVSASADRTLSLPDFVLAPVEPVSSRMDGSDRTIPVRTDDADGVRAIDVLVTYDPAQIEFTDVRLAEDLPGWSIEAILTSPGIATIKLFAEATLEAGPRDLFLISVRAPREASIGAAARIAFESIAINDSDQITARGDSAVHSIAYLGDVTGSGDHSGLDAAFVARVAVGIDSGFDAFPGIDPVIVGDVSGNGLISSLDAAFVARKAVGLSQVEIQGRSAFASAASTVVPQPVVSFSSELDLQALKPLAGIALPSLATERDPAFRAAAVRRFQSPTQERGDDLFFASYSQASTWKLALPASARIAPRPEDVMQTIASPDNEETCISLGRLSRILGVLATIPLPKVSD